MRTACLALQVTQNLLGALTIGSEYSWGTLKTILTQRPGRLSLTGGKFLALAPILLGFSFGALVVGLIGSLLYAAIAGASASQPWAAHCRCASSMGSNRNDPPGGMAREVISYGSCPDGWGEDVSTLK